MDLLYICIGFSFILMGIVGSLLPVLPGPPLSWVGLLFLYFTTPLDYDWLFLGITLAIALIVFALDYIIPALGTKRFGGTKAGMIGTSIGLIIGLIAPIPGGIIIGPFIGALVGEVLNKTDFKTALKAAFGSFLGFITGTFIKFMVAVIYAGLFITIVWEHRDILF
ncbi:DUF456 domain-containing protein [Bizionia paragorgiae]|uniref:DUF456 domain-containing protein n=1 Tax=Bizionia paragorgiae TaxID=283786 RepID=A0A1H4D3Y1_BIZPA|nr:DUF456 domain-containing protein [Bizionia paragorgiae]SEA67523.1 hypothetical protein SAMN04487990_12422 [Bizionia paragorgiae]